MSSSLNRAIQNERLALVAMQNALPLRRFLSHNQQNQQNHYMQLMSKPKEFFTENDLVEELRESLKKYVINLNQVIEIITAFKNRGLIFELSENFPRFERQVLSGHTRLNAQQFIELYQSCFKTPKKSFPESILSFKTRPIAEPVRTKLAVKMVKTKTKTMRNILLNTTLEIVLAMIVAFLIIRFDDFSQ